MNRKYPNLNDDTLLHIACREGYLRMVQFITDTKNQPQFENTELDVDVDNGKWRAPASRSSTDFTSLIRVVSRRDCEGWSLFRFLTETVPSAQADAFTCGLHAARRDLLCSKIWC